MPGGSIYDKIYDKYFFQKTDKAGTKYERLVACVIKILKEKDCVIHDIKLMGKSKEKHQIDVYIQAMDSNPRRGLIECKDFDISGEKVGLGIVRNFFGVIEDVKPDKSIIITCNGFTSNAKKYAKFKGIKLALLRNFVEKDRKQRIEKIVTNFHFRMVSEPRAAKIVMFNTNTEDKIKEQMKKIGIHESSTLWEKPIFVNTDKGKFQINDYIQEKINKYPREKTGSFSLELKAISIQINDFDPIEIKGIILDFSIFQIENDMFIISNNIAELILEGIENSDMVICDEKLKRFVIDENTGEIKPTF